MKLKITVHGVAYEVDVEVLDAGDEFPQFGALPQISAPTGVAMPAAPGMPLPPRSVARGPQSTLADGKLISPIAGTVVEVKVKAGDSVKVGDPLMIIEAMKMNTPIESPAEGTIKSVQVAKGDAVRESQTLIEFA